MPSPDPIRRKAVMTAAQLLAELTGEGAPLPAEGEPVEATVSDGELTVTVLVVRGAGRAPTGNTTNGAGGIPGSAVGPHLTGLDRQILSAATAEYQSKRQLAEACDDHEVDNYFCSRVRRLKKLGLLQTDGAGGYRRG